MTAPETSNGAAAVPEHIVFPDPPEDHDGKAASFTHLARTGAVHFLAVYLGEPRRPWWAANSTSPRSPRAAWRDCATPT